MKSSGGKYWFFEHAEWNGLTFADLLFPWFMWMMGVSMALSFEAMRKQNVSKPILWKKVLFSSSLFPCFIPPLSLLSPTLPSSFH
jgi:heparan-alpha-glucosaminide N-acetyltransferase